MAKNINPPEICFKSVFQSMFNLFSVPDYPTVGKSCCEVVRVPSLREIINTYGETGQIIVKSHPLEESQEGDTSKLGEYDIVDAWKDASALDEKRRLWVPKKEPEKEPENAPEKTSEKEPSVE